MLEYADEAGNTFRVPNSFAGRLEATTQPSTNIEDRRAENPAVPPSQPGALLAGMPQTPYEMHMYEQQLSNEQAVRNGQAPAQAPAAMVPNQPQPTPGPGDRAGIESRRQIEATKERSMRRETAMRELRTKLGI